MTTLNLKQIVIDYRMNYKTQMLIKATLCNYCVNLTQSHMKLCVYRKILCVTWRTVFLFCAFWPKFCASNTLWRRLTETLAASSVRDSANVGYNILVGETSSQPWITTQASATKRYRPITLMTDTISGCVQELSYTVGLRTTSPIPSNKIRHHPNMYLLVRVRIRRYTDSGQGCLKKMATVRRSAL